MLSVMLLLAGGAISLFALWQLKRWMDQAEEKIAAAPRRLEEVAEELVATAEAASAVVAEKAEALAGVLALADARVAELRALSPGPSPKASGGALEGAGEVRPPARATPLPPSDRELPEVHLQVCQLADSGLDVTGIARQLGMAKGEVQLILGLRRTT